MWIFSWPLDKEIKMKTLFSKGIIFFSNRCVFLTQFWFRFPHLCHCNVYKYVNTEPCYKLKHTILVRYKHLSQIFNNPDLNLSKSDEASSPHYTISQLLYKVDKRYITFSIYCVLETLIREGDEFCVRYWQIYQMCWAVQHQTQSQNWNSQHSMNLHFHELNMICDMTMMYLLTQVYN